jgi:hypothetical protein
MTRILRRGVAQAVFLLACLLPSLAVFAQPDATAEPPPAAPALVPAEPPTAAEPSATPPAAASAPDASASAELTRLREQVRALEARLLRLEQAPVEGQLLPETGGDTAALDDVSAFRIYGFADFGLNHAWLGDNSFLRGLIASETTFALGNLNLYFDFHPDPDWQVLTEIRFTAYPHGAERSLATPLGGEYARTDTEIIDVASPATAFRFRWGGILIERAYGQWSHSEHFNVRVGQFLTPYGIWNVDHGTPTLIALMMPHFVSTEIFPARQIGVELHGAILTGAWELGYNAYLSNGRTTTQLDFTSNKAFGGRLHMTHFAPLPLTLGTSFYHGAIDDIEKRITSFQPFRVEREIVIEGTEWGVGLDLSLDVDALRIRTEAIMRQVRYEPGKRPQRTSTAPGTLTSDNNEYDAYLLFAYRLPFLGLEPFAYGEVNHFVSPYGDEQAVLALGLNIHFTPFAQLKTQIARVLFFDVNAEGAFSDNDMTLLFSRLVVAF